MATKKSPPAALAPDAVKLEREFVYTGKRYSDKGEMFISIKVINEDGTLADRQSLYAYKRGRDRTVGGIYKGASFTDDGTIVGLDAAKYDRRWPVQVDVIDWQTKDEQAEIDKKRVQMEKDAGRISELEKILKPLRIQYEKMRDAYDREGCEVLERAMIRALKTQIRAIEK